MILKFSMMCHTGLHYVYHNNLSGNCVLYSLLSTDYAVTKGQNARRRKAEKSLSPKQNITHS